MKNRYLVIGLAIVLAVAVAIPAFGGPNPGAAISASAKTIAKKAKKKAKSAQQAAAKAQQDANTAQQTANTALQTAERATPLTAVVTQGGVLERGQSATSAERLGTGLYHVNFNRNLSQCAWVGQIGSGDATPVIYGEMSIFLQNNNPNGLFIQTADSNGVLGDHPFHLMVHCP
jgi:multidrug efflux pump subunit AcrA (membrane-fusion protein)